MQCDGHDESVSTAKQMRKVLLARQVVPVRASAPDVEGVDEGGVQSVGFKRCKVRSGDI